MRTHLPLFTDDKSQRQSLKCCQLRTQFQRPTLCVVTAWSVSC